MRFLAPIILALVLAGCSTRERNEPGESIWEHSDIIDVRDIPSPDGRYVCTVFGEIFHNTTGYPRHIYLRHAGKPRGYPGNVCIVPVGDDVEATWTSPTNLSVRLRFETPRAVPATTNVEGVSVVFSDITPPRPRPIWPLVPPPKEGR
jgi:hypothetical protein